MQNYDPQWIRKHYDDYGMQEWNRWELSPVERIKWFVHLHHLKSHVAADDRVLEIGAGAGRYTQELAAIGSSIVVGDFSPGQLALNRSHAQEHGFADAIEAWIECDLCELEQHFPEAAFDAVVCYGGPLSYVFDQREVALQQMIRVLKPGGKLLLGVMSLWGSVHQYFEGVLGVPIDVNREILATGNLSPNTIGEGRHYCHMFRSEQLRSLLERHQLEILTISASNCLSTNHPEFLETVPEEDPRWDHLLEMEIEACQEPGCLDLGTHLIAVCRKPT